MAWRNRMQQREEEAKEYQEAACEDEEEPGRPAPRDHRAELAEKGRELYVNMMKGASNKPSKEAVVGHYTETGEKFLDSQFPAGPSSLAENWDALEHVTRWQWKRFQWKDIDDIFPQPIKVFNDISPNDILQGALGDCYFLSTLSAMAEFPKRIEKLFETSEYEPSGCYKVKIMDMGVWKEYVLDDYFPVTAEGKIAFSGPKEDRGTTELWVILLEKAWAKRFGCYADIDAGFTNDALTDLTGAPCEVLFTNESEIWDKVFEANSRDYIITAGSGGSEESQDLVNEVGLTVMHAYAIIDAKIVKTAAGEERLLMIRNPWGQGTGEWNGDWSDSSPKWTPAVRKQLGGWQPSDDGTFWMCLDDFCTYFTDVTICRVHDDFNQTAIQVNQQPGAFTVSQLTIRKPGKVYLIVCQPDTRCFNNDPEYQYVPVRIILAKQNEDGTLEFISGRAEGKYRDVWDEYDLEPGEYLAYTEISWDGAFTTLHGISLYAHHKLGLKNVTSTNEDFLSRVYNLQLAQSMETPRALVPGVNYYCCDRVGFNGERTLEGFAFDVVENTTSAPVEVNIMHKEFENMELLPPFSGDLCTVRVAPGESVSVVKKQVDILESIRLSSVAKVKMSRR